MASVRTIHVFIASPGDLAVERRAFKEVIDALNDGFAAGAGVKFVPLGWEDTLSKVGRRPQDEINKDVDRCNVFILAMHRRWGERTRIYRLRLCRGRRRSTSGRSDVGRRRSHPGYSYFSRVSIPSQSAMLDHSSRRCWRSSEASKDRGSCSIGTLMAKRRFEVKSIAISAMSRGPMSRRQSRSGLLQSICPAIGSRSWRRRSPRRRSERVAPKLPSRDSRHASVEAKRRDRQRERR